MTSLASKKDAQEQPTIFEFIGSISTRGTNTLVIRIPKDAQEQAMALKGKAIKVTVEEIPLRGSRQHN